jgi:hypothetical protein
MTDSTSDDGRDDFILQERLSGRSARSIGKQLNLTVGEVNAALDRTLPKIDNELRVRYVALNLMRRLLRTRRERPRRRAAECGQQFPPSDGDCHTPLPR